MVFARHWEDFRIMSSATAQGNSDWCMRASFPPVAEILPPLLFCFGC